MLQSARRRRKARVNKLTRDPGGSPDLEAREAGQMGPKASRERGEHASGEGRPQMQPTSVRPPTNPGGCGLPPPCLSITLSCWGVGSTCTGQGVAALFPTAGGHEPLSRAIGRFAQAAARGRSERKQAPQSPASRLRTGNCLQLSDCRKEKGIEHMCAGLSIFSPATPIGWRAVAQWQGQALHVGNLLL